MQKTVLPDIPALDIDNVSKIYSQWQRSGEIKDILKNLLRPEKREIKALDGLSLKIMPGEFVAYAGANGAGKSTTIKILSGILQPSSGSVRVLGQNPQDCRISLMQQIGVLFGQRTELWWDHPIEISFQWKKQVWDIPDELYRRQLALVTDLLDLKPILHTFARELSLGQRMRADLAMLLLHDPKVIFLDEPTLGLDVLAKRQMIDFLKMTNRENKTTIIVTSHDMDDLEEMAQRLILISKGKMAFDGTFDDLRQAEGSLGRIKIYTKSQKAPLIQSLIYLKSENKSHEYAFDQNKIQMHQLLTSLSKEKDIINLEIQKAPIEQVIANLYVKQKKE